MENDSPDFPSTWRERGPDGSIPALVLANQYHHPTAQSPFKSRTEALFLCSHSGGQELLAPVPPLVAPGLPTLTSAEGLGPTLLYTTCS